MNVNKSLLFGPERGNGSGWVEWGESELERLVERGGWYCTAFRELYIKQEDAEKGKKLNTIQRLKRHLDSN